MTHETEAASGTEYDGPTRVSTFFAGGHAVKLYRPAEPDRLLETPGVLAWNARDDYMPYWGYLWPGSLLLADAVARKAWPRNVAALEIGCGLGLAGLFALARGLTVTFTDYDATPLRFVARSAIENGFDPARYSTERLDWRVLPDSQYPLILATEVLYEHRLVPLVANLIDRMLAPGGEALLAEPYRVTAETFEDHLRPLGLACETEAAVVEDTEFGTVRGTIYRVTRDRPVPAV